MTTSQPLTYSGQHVKIPVGVARQERGIMDEQELVSLLHAHKWSLNKRKRRGQGKIYLYAQQWEDAKRKERYIAPLSRLDQLTQEDVLNKLYRDGNQSTLGPALECRALRHVSHSRA